MANVVIVSGAGHYADPWHDFAATSGCVRGVLEQDGHDIEVCEEVESRVADLSGLDLLVVNASDSGERGDADSSSLEAARAGLLDFVARGGAVLALHISAAAFPSLDEWEQVIGGRWVRGTSMHPPIGPAHVRVHADRHPIVTGMGDFEVYDERYSYLRVDSDVVVLADHDHDDRAHPLVWARQLGSARIVYDALGHDVRSYQTPERCWLLRRSVRWLLADRDAG